MPEVQAVVLQQEALREKSLFAHSSKLYAIMMKSRNDDNVVWVFELIQFLYQAGHLAADRMSTADMEGRKSGSLVDAWVFKKKMLSFLLDEVLAKKQYADASIKEGIRAATKDINSFKNKVGYPKQPANQSWRAGWPKSADLFLKLVEDIGLGLGVGVGMVGGLCFSSALGTALGRTLSTECATRAHC